MAKGDTGPSVTAAVNTEPADGDTTTCTDGGDETRDGVAAPAALVLDGAVATMVVGVPATEDVLGCEETDEALLRLGEAAEAVG
jgi:hypothetical protein